MLLLFLLAGLAFAISTGASFLCRRVAPRVGAVSLPRPDRWNSQPVPLLGGVAIVVGTVFGLVFAPELPSGIWILLAGALALFLVGLVDDFRAISAASKLTFQLVAAALVTGFGLRFELTGIPAIDIVVTVVWLVALTNAFNLLDNMDGLSVGIASIAGAFKLSLCVVDGDWACAAAAAAFVGACLGLLVHNLAPARLFMGDAGSLFVGFFLSGLSTISGAPDSRTTASVLIVPLVIMLVPIFDTVFVTVMRLLARQSIAQGGRDHTSHRLVIAGLSERGAVLAFYVLAVLAGGLALVTRGAGLFVGVALLSALAIAMLILGVGLARVRVHASASSGDEAAAKSGDMRLPFGVNGAHIRQFATTGIQAVLVLLAFSSSYAFRYGSQAGIAQQTFAQALPIVFACKMFALALFRTYRTVWRYTDSRDLARLVQASTAGSLLSIVAVTALYGPGGELAVFALDWFLLTSLVAGVRLSLRALAEILRPIPAPSSNRVLIYGAGDTGVSLAQELRNHHVFNRTVVGFIDDDVFKLRTSIQGLPVFGGADHLELALVEQRIDEIIVAMSALPPMREHRLRRLSKQADVSLTWCRLSPSGLLIETEVA